MSSFKARSRQSVDFLPTPSPSPSPDPASFRRGRNQTAYSANMTASRPVSMAPSISSARLPTLQEIITDQAPQPYTLSAFMAFLSHNHCLETLEFTMEADRYRIAYSQALFNVLDNREDICSLWRKLIQAHIEPLAPREVNLPGPVRDAILRIPYTKIPPHPSTLDDAVRIVYELMSDSVLLPFFDSFTQPPPMPDYELDMILDQVDTQHNRLSKSSSSKRKSSRSPKTTFLPHFGMSSTRGHEGTSHPNMPQAPSPLDLIEHDLLAIDHGSMSPELDELMTPPTTPPTTLDDQFSGASSSSPNSNSSLHRVISSHNSGWKKMGHKLGLGKGRASPRSRRDSPTSGAGSPGDISGLPLSQ